MTRFNKRSKPAKVINLAGGQAYKQSSELEVASILFTSFADDKFYRSANTTFATLEALVSGLRDKRFAAQAAIYARHTLGMRSISHAMAGILGQVAKGEAWLRPFFRSIVKRPDDITEILAFSLSRYGRPIPNAMRRGLAAAFDRFDAYALGKYRGEGNAVALIDAVNLLHPVPTERNATALHALVKGELRSQDTWEREVTAAGSDAAAKTAAWDKLLREGKLGYFALLRNLRNIATAAPESLDMACEQLVNAEAIKKSLVLPFRYFTAYRELTGQVPKSVLKALHDAADISVGNMPALPGKTAAILDTSGSMHGRPVEIGALFAAAMAKSQDADVFQFADHAAKIPLDTTLPVLTLAGQIMSNIGRVGYGTNFHAAASCAEGYANAVFFSDMQGWIGHRTPTRPAGCTIFSFDLVGYGTMQFPQPGVVCLAGFSEKILEFMPDLRLGGKALIEAIRKVEV